MDTTRIAALLDPFLEEPLPALTLDQISTYIDLLIRWNARINLTSIRDPDQIVTRHFGESIFLARHLFPKHVARTLLSAPDSSHEAASNREPEPGAAAKNSSRPPQVLDLGSGAGFPALPIKLWCPGIHLTLVESNHKKAAFLREAARTLTLMNVNVIARRAESLLHPTPPQVDLVTLRAVERFPTAIPVAAQFLPPGAGMALLMGATQLPTLPKLVPMMDWLDPTSIPQSHSRVLAIGVRSR